MNLVTLRGILTCLLLLLAANANAQVERFVEGVHYARLPDLAAAMDLDTTATEKSVLEVFWYGCNHCYAFDPMLNAWVADKAGAISFARTPMIWDANTKQHARLFHTTQALGLHEQMHARIFDEIHKERNFLLDAASAGELFAEFGVDEATFTASFNSFGVDAELRKAETRQREMFIPSVPALIINGTWLINSNTNVLTHQAMLDVADFLLVNKNP
jgi:thiol:disulfide interchange protein DsbA